MNLNNNADLARRFAGLPLPQRELFYQRLCSKGISFLQMPIPRVRAVGAHALAVVCPATPVVPLATGARQRGLPYPGGPAPAWRTGCRGLKRSFAALVERHEGLRTTFRQEGGETLQVVHDRLPLEIREQSLG